MNGGILAVATRCNDPSRVGRVRELVCQRPPCRRVDRRSFRGGAVVPGSRATAGAGLRRRAGRRIPGMDEMDTVDVDSAMDLLWENDPRVDALGRNPHLGITVLSHTFIRSQSG